jgi:hypothetical protein
MSSGLDQEKLMSLLFENKVALVTGAGSGGALAMQSRR